MHDKKVDDVLKELKVSKKGLSSHQAEVRLHKYGLNEIKSTHRINPIKIFLQQFTSPLVWILIVALLISIFLKEVPDSIVIGMIVVLNAILGFYQEFRAEKSIEALQRMASPKARVLRDGKDFKIDSKKVVPGDVIIIDKVPADARLVEIHNLQTEEGPLTGESLPVTKNLDVLNQKTPLADRKNMLYSSTTITKGRGEAVVVATGMSTQVGKIAQNIQESDPKVTPLQKKLRELGKYLTIGVVIIAILIFFTGIMSGQPASVMILTAIALAVAAIPEGLPAVITISLALGVQRMVKKNALVRKLPSVETLGSVNVICTDKTGTLTHNQMTVKKIFANGLVYSLSGAGYEGKGKITTEGKEANLDNLTTLLKTGALCNDAKFEAKNKVLGDPTEAALIIASTKAGLDLPKLNTTQTRIDEIPFSSERKMMTTLHKGNQGLATSYTKGSPEIILDNCNKILINGKVQRLDRINKREILKHNELFASQALRVLACSYKENTTLKDAESDMVFLGLQAMIDPPRLEVKDSIKVCNKAGIRVIMITGDQIATAKAIATELGITGRAITGQELDKINLNEQIKDINIFARVNPEHKLHIVKVLKKKGFIVAMTGDGVNDAPALKKADIGVSMGITGTDVAKEASDMILTDDNFTSIVSAVEEGRGIFDNIRKFVNYLLSSNLGEIAVILFASIYGSFVGGAVLPLTAIQILWVNLITDGLPATALSLDPHSPGIMTKQPRPPKESILSRQVTVSVILLGGLIGVLSFILYLLYAKAGTMKVQTMVFTSLVVFEFVRLQCIRSEYGLGILSNKPLIWALLGSLILHLGVLYTPMNVWFKVTPLGLIDWGVLILAAITFFVLYKIIKKIFNI
jgi:P-type Ca2+ transporter type 2C